MSADCSANKRDDGDKCACLHTLTVMDGYRFGSSHSSFQQMSGVRKKMIGLEGTVKLGQ